MHDHKSKHYTSAQAYTDNDGLSKNFTMIDHDVKTKISNYKPGSEDVKERLKQDRAHLVSKILALPASLCPMIFVDFTIRGAETTVIKWNETMLKDDGTPFDMLTNIYTLTSNGMDLPH